MLKNLYWWVVSYDKPLYRCQTCGKLVTERGTLTGEHAKHRMFRTSHATFLEWVGLKLGVIK